MDEIYLGLTFLLGLMSVCAIVIRARQQDARAWVLVIGIGVPLALIWTVSTFARATSLSPVAEDRPIVVPIEDYVTSDSCRSCHPREYATWHRSYHRSMTQVAGPESVLAPFDGVTLNLRGREYKLDRRGDEFWVELDNPNFRGLAGEARRVERKIVMTTGSHHLQVFWLATGEGRKVAQLPFGYVLDEKRWIPDHASFVRPPWPEGHQLPVLGPAQWETGCIRCHATRGQPRISVEGLPYVDTHVAEFGISCEACHGPCGEHVRINRDPRRRYDLHRSQAQDSSVIQPGHLDSKRASEVCGQCHSVHTDRSIAAAFAWQNGGSSFCAGDNLFQERHIVRGHGDEDHPVTKRFLEEDPQFLTGQFWSDGMVRVGGREFSAMIESGCYKEGELSCLSCHAMHQSADDPRSIEAWADDQLHPGMRGNDACLPCHAKYAKDIKSHTHHEPASSGSLCYNCHMPHATYALHKAIRNHHIDSPSVQASLTTGRPNACNQCHLDKTLAWSADHLFDWYGIARPELSDDQRRIAASVLWSLTGDAGQRALMAWSMGWEDAIEASGSWWMEPFLMQALLDSYEAVRFIAYRSLRKRYEFRELQFDFVAPLAERRKAIAEVSREFDRRRSMRADRAGESGAVLIGDDGSVNRAEFARLLSQQDHSPIQLRE
ncbi:MAG: multiheme c-type cytochrome [Planctomycetota bacterium]|jgi:hypothetical protein